jgi:hypothetical protein
MIGFGMVLPLATHPFSPWLLVAVPLAWLIIFVTVRLAAGLLPRSVFPGEE